MEISTDERFTDCVEYLARKFKTPVQHVNQRDVIIISPKVNQYQITDAIIHLIVTKMKAKYLTEKIKIKHEILIRILVNYDKKTDILIATTLIAPTPTLLFDALYDFGINKLKCRWDEIVQLVNDNHLQLTQKQMFNDLLRFLILNMDNKVKEAHVMLVDQHVAVCNSNLEPFKTKSDNVIYTLIDLAPRQIFIHAEQNMPTKIIKDIEQLFTNCVCIQYNAVL